MAVNIYVNKRKENIMIKILPFTKTPIKNYKNTIGLQPILQNSNDYIKINDDVAQKPKEIVTAIKEMVANYARHEAISINFKKAPLTTGEHVFGSSNEKIWKEIAENSVIVEVEPIQTIPKLKPSKISTNLDSKDFSENVRKIYTDIQKLTTGIKNNTKYVL